MVGTRTLNIKINENETDKFANVKKFGVTSTSEVTTKRAALGDIQNRGALRAVNGKETLQKDLKDTKLQNALRNTKVRVDSHWKKGALGTTSNATSSALTTKTLTTTTATTANTNAATAKPTGLGAAVAAERKILTRSNSVRVGGVSTTTTGIGLQRQGSSNLILGQYKTKTVTATTKLVESKLQQVKIVNKKSDEKLTSSNEGLKTTTTTATTTTTTLRREDSNLSRKSLTKLKAALNRDPSSAAIAKALTKTSSNAMTNAKVQEAVAKFLNKAKTNASVATTTTTTTTCIEKEIQEEKSTKTTTTTTAALKDLQSLNIASAPPAAAPAATHSSRLLEGVEDIDAGDAENLVLVSEYVNDIYDYLYSLEIQHPVVADHLEGQEEVTPRMRAVLIDWLHEVSSQFHLAVETFQMTVAIIDRYLQKVKDTKRAHLQLVGVTALFIATKYEELFPPAISDFVYITDNAYTARQVRQMELKILKHLDYNLSNPVPIHFLRRFSKAIYAEDKHHAMAKYFCELALVEYELAAYKPSEIAAASLFLALHLLNDNATLPTGFKEQHWTATLEFYSRYSAEHLKPITKKIAMIARNAQTAKLKAVFIKYEASKFYNVSKKSELYGPLMDSLIKSKN